MKVGIVYAAVVAPLVFLALAGGSWGAAAIIVASAGLVLITNR